MQPAPLWTGLGLIAPLGGRVSGRPPPRIEGVSIDTRTLAEDDLFVALKGDNGDGHDHVRAAFEKGAAAALVDEAHAADLAGEGPLYVVPDVLRGLENLARAARARTKARVVAVTGSVGKTTTKEALKCALAPQGATHASVASYNNHWGVPLTLARMPAPSRFAIIEIGMNHAGEITPLVAMARPHVAIVTKVAAVHLEHFGSLEAIAAAKAEIFSGVVKGGVAVLNRDDAQFEFLRARAEASPAGFVLTFGASEGGDARLLSAEPDGEGMKVAADILGQRVDYRIGAPGAHMAVNSLAVLLAARACGADLIAAAEALAGFCPPSGRGRREKLLLPEGEAVLIDESYNANPASMNAALDLLGATPANRRIAILGDMLELGPQGPELHAGLAEAIERNGIDLVFAAGTLMKSLAEALPAEKLAGSGQTSADIEADALAAVLPGDAVMVKGSNGSRMGRIVAALRERFAPPADGG